MAKNTNPFKIFDDVTAKLKQFKGSAFNGIDFFFTPERAFYGFDFEGLYTRLWSGTGIAFNVIFSIFGGALINFLIEHHAQKRREQLIDYRNFIATRVTKYIKKDLQHTTWSMETFHFYRDFEKKFYTLSDNDKQLLLTFLQVKTEEKALAIIYDLFEKKGSLTFQDILIGLADHLHHKKGELATVELAYELFDGVVTKEQKEQLEFAQLSKKKRILKTLKSAFNPNNLRNTAWDYTTTFGGDFWISVILYNIFFQPGKMDGSLTDDAKPIFIIPFLGLALNVGSFISKFALAMHNAIYPKIPVDYKSIEDKAERDKVFLSQLSDKQKESLHVNYFDKKTREYLSLRAGLQHSTLKQSVDDELNNVLDIDINGKNKTSYEETLYTKAKELEAEMARQRIERNAGYHKLDEELKLREKKVEKRAQEIKDKILHKGSYLTDLRVKSIVYGFVSGLSYFINIFVIGWVIAALLSGLFGVVMTTALFTIPVLGITLASPPFFFAVILASGAIGLCMALYTGYNTYVKGQEFAQKFEFDKAAEATLEELRKEKRELEKAKASKRILTDLDNRILKLEEAKTTKNALTALANSMLELEGAQKDFAYAKQLQQAALAKLSATERRLYEDKFPQLKKKDWDIELPLFAKANMLDIRATEALSFKVGIKTILKKIGRRLFSGVLMGESGSFVPRLIISMITAIGGVAVTVSVFALFSANPVAALIMTLILGGTVLGVGGIGVLFYNSQKDDKALEKKHEMLVPSDPKQLLLKDRVDEQTKVCREYTNKVIEQATLLRTGTEIIVGSKQDNQESIFPVEPTLTANTKPVKPALTTNTKLKRPAISSTSSPAIEWFRDRAYEVVAPFVETAVDLLGGRRDTFKVRQGKNKHRFLTDPVQTPKSSASPPELKVTVKAGITG